MSNLRSGLYGEYYGSFFNESVVLSKSQMEKNAKYIYSALRNKGWSENAIFGMLGNIEAESSINPGRWQSDNVGSTSNGYGLVQWTPSTKYTNWCIEQGFSDPSEMDNNISRIIYEVENNEQWIATSTYNFSFKDFSTSDLSVTELAKAFLLCYERPADQSESVQEYRGTLASYYAELLTGVTPEGPDTPTTQTTKKKRKYNFLLMNSRKRRESWIRQH